MASSSYSSSDPPDLVESIQRAKLPQTFGSDAFRHSGIAAMDQVKEKYADLLAIYHSLYVCKKCNLRFRPAENFVQLGCTTHIGRLLKGEWQCCGRSTHQTGCTSSMHSNSDDFLANLEAHPFDAIVTVPYELIDMKIVRANYDLILNLPRPAEYPFYEFTLIWRKSMSRPVY